MRLSTRSIFPLALVAHAQAAHHTVAVGRGGLKFDPETIEAKVGDTITYTFFARNHSVVESSFAEPCQPLSGGIFSGFVPTESQDEPSRTTFTIFVDDEKPIWLYCSQTNGNHCQNGMVHAINPPKTGNTFEAYKRVAKTAPTSRSPPDGRPMGGIRRIEVDVGKGGRLEFVPSKIMEPVGTVVRFNFDPKNHSVTESSFDNPCQPIEGGFSSGFIPTQSSPSGVTFDYTIVDDKPKWFYCGQGTHCQSGMVGSINAPTVESNSGRTHEDFVAKAQQAPPPSKVPPNAPLGGTLTVNGTIVTSLNGNVLPDKLDGLPTTTAPPIPIGTGDLPPPGIEAPDYYAEKAGGGKPTHWNWAPSFSDEAAAYLQFHSRIEDLLLHLLWDGHRKLEAGGAWAGVYPAAIVKTIGAWAAQSLIHRATTGEILAHYNRSIPASCKYILPSVTSSVNDFIAAFSALNNLQIGVLTDMSVHLAKADPFVVPFLLSQAGAKSRAGAVVSMIRNHLAASAPREIGLPAKLAWSYVMNHFVDHCPDKLAGMPDQPWKVLEATLKVEERAVSVQLKYEGGVPDGKAHYVAWIGPYGSLEFTELDEENMTSIVPGKMYGDIWIVVVDKDDLQLAEIPDHLVAGPQLVWIDDPE